MQFLIKANIETLGQLKQVLSQLTLAEYKQTLKVLHQNSLGQHVRHVLEFYQCLFTGMPQGLIDYDSRQRDLRLESDLEYAVMVLTDMMQLLESSSAEKALKLQVSFGHVEPGAVHTTVARELTYLIEHSIHHMAIINIALSAHFEAVVVPHNFGIAYSTVGYKQTRSA